MSSTDSELLYSYTCPSCSGAFSLPVDRIPPVRARFPCANCGDPMDFPSRDQARIHARLQADAAQKAAAAEQMEKAAAPAGDDKSFRVDKRGWEDDRFDRRAVRNLIRTGELVETDHIFLADGSWVVAGEMADLKSLFDLKRHAKLTPPRCCRTHTDRPGHFTCRDSDRPLCEECAPEKELGGRTVRVCAHCGGAISDLAAP